MLSIFAPHTLLLFVFGSFLLRKQRRHHTPSHHVSPFLICIEFRQTRKQRRHTRTLTQISKLCLCKEIKEQEALDPISPFLQLSDGFSSYTSAAGTVILLQSDVSRQQKS
ncbi:hypothetical protein EJ02DRAFT_202720 [Clathrospora elynae]|uniref:Secreted protein n=1 Tax=Clathrospora elynae TaxID=706981 RepID=A0A6A5SP23_9PLEO|nr:hypothetical protein EJ02DRAFT_202720 [Clathrospora elynae]